MTTVYIGNATRQVLHFAYRLPERKPITQMIRYGAQSPLTVDCSQPDIDALLNQWGKYGLVKLDELESSRKSKEFQGYLISIGKQIPQSIMDKAAKYRDEVLASHSEKARKEAAEVMVHTIENETGEIAKTYEISVAEIEPQQGFTNPNDPHVAQGWRIDRDQRPNMPPLPSARRHRA
jgi:hypothetical protein